MGASWFKSYTPKTDFIKVESLRSTRFFSDLRAQQMEMTVRKSTFQGFRQVYIVGGARYRKPFKKNQTDFLPEMANYVNVQGTRSLLLQPFEEGEK